MILARWVRLATRDPAGRGRGMLRRTCAKNSLSARDASRSPVLWWPNRCFLAVLYKPMIPRPVPSVLFCALVASFVPCLLAQGRAGVEAVGLAAESDGTSWSSLGWDSKVVGEWAGLRWTEPGLAHTLPMVRAQIDPDAAGAVVAAGISELLPFLATPPDAGWQLSDPVFASMQGVNLSGAAPGMEPIRIKKHLQLFQSQFASPASGLVAGFGTFNPSQGVLLQYANPGMVSAPLLNPADARQPWLAAGWRPFSFTSNTNNNANASGVPNPGIIQAVDVTQFGRAAARQAAYEYWERHPELPLFDAAALDAMIAHIDEKFGLSISVQPIHVKLPPIFPGPVTDPDWDIEFKTIIIMTRYRIFVGLSAYDDEGLSLDRWILSPRALGKRIYLAPRDGMLHIEFDRHVGSNAQPTTLRAFIPVPGGYRMVPQIANPTDHESNLIRPEVARFRCPPSAIPGLVYFEEVSNPGVLLAPLGSVSGGASIWVYSAP